MTAMYVCTVYMLYHMRCMHHMPGAPPGICAVDREWGDAKELFDRATALRTGAASVNEQGVASPQGPPQDRGLPRRIHSSPHNHLAHSERSNADEGPRWREECCDGSLEILRRQAAATLQEKLR